MEKSLTNGHLHACGCGEEAAAPLQEASDPREATITRHFAAIMEALGLDLSDPSLRDTPQRVARMYLRELFVGLDPAQAPTIRLFPNSYGYRQILVEKEIRVRSVCEHHFVPIIGVAHVAYIPREYVVGLSKLNRVVDYFSRRPQVQERLTHQIATFLAERLHTPDVAVVIDAKHYCVSMRGIQDEASRTVTYAFLGAFQDISQQETLFRLISLS